MRRKKGVSEIVSRICRTARNVLEGGEKKIISDARRSERMDERGREGVKAE